MDDGVTAADVLQAGLDDLSLDAAHVCVRRLRIAVRLRVSQADGDAQIRRMWSRAAQAAVRAQLAAARPTLPTAVPGIVAPSGGGPGRTESGATDRGSDPGGARDGDVVIYRRPWDATVDLVRCLSLGDSRRAWAWRQCGLLRGPAPSTPAERARTIAAALVADPPMIPAVLAMVDEPLALPLDVPLWLRTAEVWAASATSPGEPVSAVPRDAAPLPPAVVAATLRSAVGRGLAPHRDAVRRLNIAARTALARLALACTVPHRIRDERMVAAVALAVVTQEATAEMTATATTTAGRSGRPAMVTGPMDDITRSVSRPLPSENVEPMDEPMDERLFTHHGGLLFLVWPIGQVVAPDLPAEELPGAVARLCGRLTDVDADDPAVRALTGPLPDAEPDPARSDDPDGERERLVRAWLLDRLYPPEAGGEPVDLDWLWHRPALIDLAPGWIDAEFPLDEVDLRIRRALLDLDPGWLWWRGAVMRFRYV
jgi:hypothetical protein